MNEQSNNLIDKEIEAIREAYYDELLSMCGYCFASTLIGVNICSECITLIPESFQCVDCVEADVVTFYPKEEFGGWGDPGDRTEPLCKECYLERRDERDYECHPYEENYWE